MNTAMRILKVVISVAGGVFFTNVCGNDVFVVYVMITYVMLSAFVDNQQLKKRIDSIENSLQSNSETAETTEE
ncbi:MAG: hypothetical protein NC247_02245 [Ruminococcus flavefaciens]|nr:hypothetical protein [Ruminococcus flavefaciens]